MGTRFDNNPFEWSADPEEIRQRLAVVREAKRRKFEAGKLTDLTCAELDLVLPPVDCKRTRDRLRKPGWRERARD